MDNQATIDTRTAVTWGALAVRDYTNAIVVAVPESGHGTIRFSRCAKDITAAWIDDPAGGTDTSCVQGLRLPVTLPDGTMHPLPCRAFAPVRDHAAFPAWPVTRALPKWASTERATSSAVAAESVQPRCPCPVL